jgi:hypothetical protein
LGNATLWCASDGDKILVMTSNREVLESLSTVLQDAVEASTDTEPISSDSSATEEATRE